MANINARSPYLVRVYDTSITSVTLDVWIYTGTQATSSPVTPTYALNSTMVNDEAVFDISPLVKDYMDVNFNGNYSTEIVWVDYRVTKNTEREVYYYSSTFYSNNSLTTSIGTLYFAHGSDDYDFDTTGTSPSTIQLLANPIYADSTLSTPYTALSTIYNARNKDLIGTYTINTSTGYVSNFSQGFIGSLTVDSQFYSEKTIVDEVQEAIVQNTAYYGYGYFEDGVNPNNYTGISNGVYNFIPDSDELDQPSWTINSGATINTIASGDSYSRVCEVFQSGSTSVDISVNLLEALPVGQEVTISCWVLFLNAGGATTRPFQLGYYNGGSFVNGVDLSITESFFDWQFLSHTFTVNDSYVSIPRIRFNGYANGSANDIYRIWNCACYLGQPNQGQMSTYGVPGIMKTNKRNIKLSVDAIYKPENETFNLGVTSDEGFTTNDGLIKAYQGNTQIASFAHTIVNDTGESDEVVNYLQIPTNADRINLIYYGNSEFSYVHNTFDIPVYSVCEPKYTPYKLTFINRYGILEDLWFFKNSKLSLETKEESYRANIVSGGSYSISNHQYKTLYKEGKESLTINSGFYPESHNEAFKQLLLSEQVWINYKGQTLPCKIKDSSMSFKTQVQDKLISYTMNIEFAFDKINNVR